MEEMWRTIWELQKKLAAMEEELRRLKAAASKQRAIHIRRVVYRIDSLHVRTVRGTLHIGITSPGEGSGLEQLLPDLEGQKFGSLDSLEQDVLEMEPSAMGDELAMPQPDSNPDTDS